MWPLLLTVKCNKKDITGILRCLHNPYNINSSHSKKKNFILLINYSLCYERAWLQVELHSFLISALDGSEGLVSRPIRFSSDGKFPHARFLRSYLGPEQNWMLWREKHVTFRAGNRAKIFRHPAGKLVTKPTKLSVTHQHPLILYQTSTSLKGCYLQRNTYSWCSYAPKHSEFAFSCTYISWSGFYCYRTPSYYRYQHAYASYGYHDYQVP